MGIRIETRQPKTWLLVLSLIVVLAAIIGHFTRIPYLTQYQFWVAVAGYVILVLATL